MQTAKQDSRRKKNYFSNAINVVWVAVSLLFLFSSDAKSWLLQQLVTMGLFKAEIKQENANSNVAPAITAFSVQDSAGQIFSTNDLKGKVVFINFWATWCPPCRAEMPSLNQLYTRLKDDQRFVFLFVSEDDNLAKAKEYLTQKSFSIPLYSRSSNLPNEVFDGTLPTTIVLNKEGQLVMKHEGLAGYNTEAFIEQLKALL